MNASPDLKDRLAEAARYALLRRLAPALRHNMAGALQPVAMIATMLEKRLQKPAPDFAALAKNSNDINTLSREAAATCMALMTWLAPKDNEKVPAGEGIADAVGLLVTELSFRGFTVVNESTGCTAAVPRSLLRNAFMASLIALTDEGKSPANVVISATAESDALVVRISLAPTDGEPSGNASHAYRALDWSDVDALVAADNATLVRGDGSVELHFNFG
ncbi:MAG: hypothetical protein EOO28_09905 [Comamonadaceae bacterium]|nr:MAG: hypothetical protein EOO28_09905 [Comamonadaceae bacterium]